MKDEYAKIHVGQIINPLRRAVRKPILIYKELALAYPSRLNAMALDPSKINVNKSGIYSPGEIVFPIQIFKKVKIKTRSDGKIMVVTNIGRPQILEHAALIMKKTFAVKEGFSIEFESKNDMKHLGLGSSSGMIATVAACINEMYGNPVEPLDLIAFLAQNHGEEIDGEKHFLQRVQCIGGAASAGLIRAGMIVIAGISIPISTMRVPKDYKIVIGIPRDFYAPDAQKLMSLELKNMHKFIDTGKKYGPRIAYDILHKTLPAMQIGDLKQASEIIFDYRFRYGSIRNCSFVYPKMNEIANKIEPLFKKSEILTLALSSVGPAFFAITKTDKQCLRIFNKLGMNSLVTKINNTGYRVLSRQKA